ncbi:MAG: LysR family transcriptional regulator [Mangrovicoccus sp.]|nr:LysR family transcriptional regulator [Mangrovicoccus sp.]
MGQFEDLKLFVWVVDQGSIAKAAEQLGIAKSAVSRRLGQLESRYDMRLIDRKPGTWRVTEAGKELYQRAAPMIAEADDLDTDFRQTASNLSGSLRVTIAHEFGMTFLKPMLFQFAKDHPQIDLVLDFDDRRIDLDRENYDLAIRITAGSPEGASDIKLGTTRHGMFASPDYLHRHGTPTEPRALRAHALLHYGASRRASWSFTYEGKATKIEFRPVLNSNAGAFLKDAAIEGMGILRLPDFVVRRAVQDGSLVPVLPSAEFQEFGIHLVQAPNRRLNKRMRIFVKAVQDQCAIFRI